MSDLITYKLCCQNDKQSWMQTEPSGEWVRLCDVQDVLDQLEKAEAERDRLMQTYIETDAKRGRLKKLVESFLTLDAAIVTDQEIEDHKEIRRQARKALEEADDAD